MPAAASVGRSQGDRGPAGRSRAPPPDRCIAVGGRADGIINKWRTFYGSSAVLKSPRDCTMLGSSMRRVGLIDITVGNATRLGASQRSATRRCASHHIATQRLSRWGSPAARARLATDSAPYSSRTVAYLSSTCEIPYPLTSLAGLRPVPGYHPPDYRSLILICQRACIYFQSRST